MLDKSFLRRVAYSLLIVATSVALFVFTRGNRETSVNDPVENYWNTLPDSYWEMMPNARIRYAGTVILHFGDSVVTRTLYSTGSNVRFPMGQDDYQASADSVTISDQRISFHGPDTIQMTTSDGITLVYARTSADAVTQMSEMTDDLDTKQWNNLLTRIHYAPHTRFYAIDVPGTLSEMLESTPRHALEETETLCICGPMNGLDINALLCFLGEQTEFPNIRRLDLSKSWIVTDTVVYNAIPFENDHDSFASSPTGFYRRMALADMNFQATSDSVDVLHEMEGYIWEVEPDSLYYFCPTTNEGVIGFSAFSNLMHIEHLKLPCNTHTIQRYAVVNCPELQSVTLPAGVVDIEKNAFDNNPKLAIVHHAAITRQLQWMRHAKESLFVGCHPNLIFESHAPERPVVQFRIHITRKAYDNDVETDNLKIRNGLATYDQTHNARKYGLSHVAYRYDVIAEDNADIHVDAVNDSVWGTPLNEAFNSYRTQLQRLDNKLENMNYALQREWREDSIRAIKGRIDETQYKIVSIMTDACQQESQTPIPGYLFQKFSQRLSIPQLQFIYMLIDDEYNMADIRILCNRLIESSRINDFDWEALADTSRMTHIVVPEAGTLVETLTDQFCRENNRIRISGTLNETDVQWLNRQTQNNQLVAIDMSEVEMGIYLPDSAFIDCHRLQYVRLPKSLQTIGRNAFTRCVSLREVVMPRQLISIRTEAFFQCLNLRYLNLPDNLLSIEAKAFAYTGLRTVRLPERTFSVDYQAFANCEFLTSLYIPAETASIGMNLTLGCPSVRIAVHPSNKYFAAYDGHLVGLTESTRKMLHQYDWFGTLRDKKK